MVDRREAVVVRSFAIHYAFFQTHALFRRHTHASMGVIGRIIEAIIELWIPAIILLVGLTLILGRKRIWTVLALVAVGLFIVAAVKRITSAPDESISRAPIPRTSLATAIDALASNDAELTDLRITGSTAPWRFTGTITNLVKTHTLTSAIVEIRRMDCYEAALDPSGCVVLWKGNKRVDLDVPPSETRSFAEPVSPRGSVPRPQGELRDEFELVGLNGRRQPDAVEQ